MTEERDWHVECRTCDWWHSDDARGDALDHLRTALDAVITADDHRCEPQIHLRSPDGTWYGRDDLDRWGNPTKAKETPA